MESSAVLFLCFFVLLGLITTGMVYRYVHHKYSFPVDSLLAGSWAIAFFGTVGTLVDLLHLLFA